jgi:hypothetical protein
MQIARSILLLMTGAATCFAFLLSCGDDLGVKASADAPSAPDAVRTCDCPSAEPPLAGRLVVQEVISILDSNQQGSTHIFCPGDARPISGSCTVDMPVPDKDVTLRESGFIAMGILDNRPAWRCSFRNNEPTQIQFKIAVLCLKPAS